MPLINMSKEEAMGLGYDISEYSSETVGVSGRGLLGILGLEIPDTIEGKPVTNIKPHGFSGIRTDRLVLPTHLDAIGFEAFNGCNIRVLDFSKSVFVRHIGRQAFQNAGLQGHLELPESVKYIEELAFATNNLTGITINSTDIEIATTAFGSGPNKFLTIHCSRESKVYKELKAQGWFKVKAISKKQDSIAKVQTSNLFTKK